MRLWSSRALGVRRLGGLLVASSLLLCLWPGQAGGAGQAAASAPGYAADRILVQPNRETSHEALARFHAAQQGKVLQTSEGIGGLQVVYFPAGEDVPGLNRPGQLVADLYQHHFECRDLRLHRLSVHKPGAAVLPCSRFALTRFRNSLARAFGVKLGA